MSKKMLAFILLNTFIIQNIKSQSKHIDSLAVVVLKVDPQSAKGARVSELFDEVEFIPLETTKESLFGTISKLKIIGDNFVIFDFDTKSILIFDKNGKYINKIKSVKNNSGPSDLYDYEIVEYKNQEQIQITVNDNRTIFCYDANGKFLEKRPVTTKSIEQKKISNSEYNIREFWRDKDSTLYEYTLLKGDSLSSKYFPLNNGKGAGDIFYSANGVNQQDIKTNYFLTRRYNYDVYKLTLPNISLVYRFLFPRDNSLPENFLYDPQYIGRANRKKYFDTNKEVIYGLSNIHLFGSNLFFKIGTTSGGVGGANAFVFKLKSKEVISLNHVEPDIMSFFLPINDSGLGFDFLHQGFYLCSKGYLFTSYSSLVMFKNKNENKEKSINYNETLNNYFKTQNAKSNPIIVKLKPKNN